METCLFRFISVEIPIITQPHLEYSNGYISIKQIKMQLLLDQRVVLVHIHGKKRIDASKHFVCSACANNASLFKMHQQAALKKKLTESNIVFFFIYKKYV